MHHKIQIEECISQNVSDTHVILKSWVEIWQLSIWESRNWELRIESIGELSNIYN